MKKHYRWAAPLLLFLAIAPFTPKIDLFLSHLFFDKDTCTFFDNSFTHFFYTYGEWPAFMLGGLALGTFIFSFFLKFLKKWRFGSLALVLTLVLGSGIIVNGVLKEYWPRPRPKQIKEFGGEYSFRPFYQPSFSMKKSGEKQKSFPSGHATMGFYFLSLLLVGRRYKNTFLVYTAFGLTLFWGIGLMLVRIMQGGHFFSDTVAAALIMWEVAFLIDYLVFTKGKDLLSPNAQDLKLGDTYR